MIKQENILALTRLNFLGDWCKLKIKFHSGQLLKELEKFDKDWKRYNPRKEINRYGLSITSFDGGLSGVPDLDSLQEYNRENNTRLDNFNCIKFTEVYKQSSEIQKILQPFQNHLLRTHLIKLNSGGFFPDHRDCYPEFESDFREQIRLIFFVKKCEVSNLKFIYDNQLKTDMYDGSVYYFNANKSHCVFSTSNDCIFIVANLKFDVELYHILTKLLAIN